MEMQNKLQEEVFLMTNTQQGTAAAGEKPLVSIIVPVYKVENYIQKCLDSLKAQTYEQIEVLLVDDGSPDASADICEKFAQTDSRFRVMHQENQGQAAARNHAVLEANGDWIMFVDSDDYVAPDCVKYLVSLVQKYQADISLGSFFYRYENTPEPVWDETGKVFEMTAQEALIRMNYSQGIGAMPWAKLFRKENVLAHPFPVGVIYEDLATTYKLFCDAKKVVFGTRRIYCWLQREGSTMHMKFDDRQLYGIQAVKDQYAYVQERFPEALPSVKARYVGKIIELMALALQSGSKDAYRTLKNQLAYTKEALHDPKIKKTVKLRLIAAKMGYMPAKLVFSLHESMKKRAAISASR